MIKRKKGFTLVELLVVMAIIAILAAIVVPNVTSYIRRARAVRALGDIKGIELALTKMLTDANCNSLGNMFNPDLMRKVLYPDQTAPPFLPLTKERFEQAMTIYTRTTYALLREGRLALTDTDGIVSDFSQYLNATTVKKLGTSYLEDVAFDPWGEMYHIFPGPWPTNRTNTAGTNEPNGNLNIFRTFMPTVQSNSGAVLPGTKISGGRPDALTLNYPAGQEDFQDPDTGEFEIYGYSAPRDKMAFIYSSGQNMTSGQAIYGVPYATDGKTAYVGVNSYAGEDPATWGGGDDINNWDNDQSWMRFYN